MKTVIQWLGVFGLLVAGPGVWAQSESFDLVTFATPAGQRSAQADAVTFSDATATTFLQLAVYRSVASSGNPAQDFAVDWSDLVARPYRITGSVNSETTDWPGGWTLTLGAAPVYSDSARNFVSLLAVFTGHGVKVAVLINYNDDLYRPKVDRFLESIRLRTPPVPAPAATPVACIPTGNPSGPSALTNRKWYRSIAQYSNWGYNPTAAEIAKIGNQGYARWTYVFNPDGTYSFVGEFWSMNRHQDYWFHEETGTFRTSGDTMTITPQTARRVRRNKAGQPQGAATPVDLEPATYRYRFHFFSGIGEWNLVLSPTTGQQTRRDGVFANNSDFPTSYLYSSPPADR